MPARIHGAPRLTRPLCAIVILFAGPATVVYAQPAEPAPAGIVTRPADAEDGKLELVVGHSAVLNVGVPITRVSLTRPEIADAVATSSQQLLIHGKAPGSITMFVWDRAGGIKRYEVRVRRDLGDLTRQMEQLFPGEPITVAANGSSVVISGTVSSKYVAEKAAEVAAGYVENKENVVNLLRQGQSTQSNQVLLRVRFAEVSRTALTELGGSFFTSALGYKDWVGRTTTQQFSAPIFDTSEGVPKLVFSDYLNLFLFNNKEGLGTVIRALQNKGLFQSLAEPNLIAENGKEASFLAGGEYPYPAIQGSGANLAVTISFKEFGIRLNFTPTILGNDMIHLKVRPEVSSLDFSNAVTYQGFRIPALSTRRAETEVELENGQTFAIAGLLSNNLTSTMAKIPGIGDIPILGLLFRSKAAQKAQTELVVMITPQIVPRSSHGAASSIPGLIEPYLGAPGKVIPPPPPYAPDRRAPGSVQDLPPAASEQPQAPPALPAPATQLVPGDGSLAVPSDAVRRPAAAAEPLPASVDPKAVEREEKAARKRAEEEARALAKKQEEERKLREAEAKRAAEEAKRQAALQTEAERAEARRAAEEAKRQAKLKAEQEKAEKKRAEEERKVQERLERERAKAEAEAAAQRAEAEKQRLKEVKEAEERLKQAQAAYEAALAKTKKDKQ
ncbi:MAG: pilus assembly protein N-terminal domain-containing protein [Vicinamibacterales bacterium]